MSPDRNQTHYEVLGVPPGATQEEIRSSYHLLASHYHPDRHQGNPLQELASERMTRINAAYEVLSDPRSRAEYNTSLGHAAGPDGGRVKETSRRSPGFWLSVIVAVALFLLVLRPLLFFVARVIFIVARTIALGVATPVGMVATVALLAGVYYIRKRRRG